MRQYIVDAFTDRLFSGNQAAVCVMDAWIGVDLMRDIAVENRFSETAFAVPEDSGYRLRWYTPEGEIDFCGHATLGTASVIFRWYRPEAGRILFHTQVGDLTVERRGDLYAMDLPAYALREVPVTDAMEEALGTRPLRAFLDRDLMMVLGSEEEVRSCAPDLEKIRALDGLCVAVTARGAGDADCVSRVFAPRLGVPEDPVTGSTHCMIVPYWARRLGKDTILARQASGRGGVLYGRDRGDRAEIAGKTALYSIAEILPGS